MNESSRARRIVWGTHAPRVLVAAPRRNELFCDAISPSRALIGKVRDGAAPSPAREARALPSVISTRLATILAIVVIPLGSAFGQQPAAPPASPSPALSAPAAVAAPSAQSEEDIRDIRGPISIPSPWRWLWVAGAVTAVLGLLYAGWRWYRLFAAVRAKQPDEIALERLDRARSLMTPEQAREYSFAVSEITREYIEGRFGERAARRTTDEFLHDLVHQSESPLATHQSLLQDFLRHCDLAKFARWQLNVSEMESMDESARTFIVSTRPEPEPTKRAPARNGTPSHPQPSIVGAMPGRPL